MFMYKTSKSVYVFSVDCMHFALFLDTLGYNFLRKYIYIYIYFLNIFRSAEGQEVPPHSFDIAFDIYAYIYIYISLYTPTARSRIFFSRVGRLRRAVPCRGLCCLPRSAPRLLRLPKQHHAVFTLAAPPRTHGRRAARPQLQSPHGRRRTAAAMHPVARDRRHLRRNRPNLGGVEVVAETLQPLNAAAAAAAASGAAEPPANVPAAGAEEEATAEEPLPDVEAAGPPRAAVKQEEPSPAAEAVAPLAEAMAEEPSPTDAVMAAASLAEAAAPLASAPIETEETEEVDMLSALAEPRAEEPEAEADMSGAAGPPTEETSDAAGPQTTLQQAVVPPSS